MTFDQAIKIVLKYEGGYTNDLKDPGGETNYGICKRQFPNVDIKNLTIEEAKDIYFLRYWSAMKLDGIKNSLLKLHLFDMGVNAGQSTSIKLLQNILNIKDDGCIGPITLKAINDYPDQSELSQRFALIRLDFYQKKTVDNPNLKKFLKGWQNRVNAVSNEYEAIKLLA
jgi:lysozyme family protein